MIKKKIDLVMPTRKSNPKLPFLNERIQEFFTDTEYIQESFDALLTGPESARRVLNIHAPYMMGKSALLSILYLSCRDKGKYVALADARHATTPQDILRELAGQLEAYSISLPSYRKALKIVLEDPSAPQPWESKVTEAPDLVKRGAAIAHSVKPLSKPWMIEIGMGVIDTILWWRKRKQEKAAEKERDERRRVKEEVVSRGPFKVLSEYFIEDLKKLGEPSPRPIVLMLDHFEHVTDAEGQLRDWVSALVSDPGFLIVVAGRSSIDHTWSVRIPIQTEELRPMDDPVIGELVGNYCKARAIDRPSETQVMNIVRFAAHVPYLALWAIEICRDKRVPDWDIEKFLRLTPGGAWAIGQRLESLLQESTENKSTDFSLALEAAAIVRWFNYRILKDLVGDIADKFYQDIEGLPIVFRDGERLSIPSPVREVINRKLRSENPERYFRLHQKASESYERRLKQLEADPQRLKNKQTLVLENLYHEYQFETDDVPAALHAEQYFQEAFTDAFNRRQFDFCESLLTQVVAFDTLVTSKDWVKFYRSLMNWYRQTDVTEARRTLEQLAQDPTLDDNLLAYLYEVLGWINWYVNNIENAKDYFEKSLDVRQRNPKDVLGRVRVQVWQGVIYQRTAGVGEQYLTKALDLAEGFIGQSANAPASGQPQVPLEKEREQLRPILGWAHLELGNSLMLHGRFKEARDHIERSIDAYKRLALRFQHGRALMTYGRLLIYQGELKAAEDSLSQSIQLFRDFREPWTEAWAESWLGDAALQRGNPRLAQEHYTSAKKKWSNDLFGHSVADGGLAEAALASGEFDQALKIAASALKVKEKFEDPFGVAWTQNTIGNALLAKNDDMRAQQAFDEGLQSAKTYGSFLAEALLGLGKCRLLHFRNDEPGFIEAAKGVEDLACQYSFFDFLAHIHFLRATLDLRKLAEKKPALSDIDIERLTEMFLDSLMTALRHNVFLLDALLDQTIEALGREDGLLTEKGASVQATIVQSLRDRWKQTKIGNKTLDTLEKRRRAAEDLDQRHRETVLDRLKLDT